jgi:serine/threonine-protein kinase
MFILALITTSSVAVVMFIFGGLIARPFKVLNQSLKGFASGNLDTRISLTRNDEIGEVFDGFNNMAAAIQDRYTEVTDELAQTGINKTGTAKNKQGETAAKADNQGLKEQSNNIPDKNTSKATEFQLPTESEQDNNDEGKSETNRQTGLNDEPNKTDQDEDKVKPDDSALVSESEPELDLNPDQTVIATSQIGLDVNLQQQVEKSPDEKQEVEGSFIELSVDIKPDETIASTSQIGLDTAPSQEPVKTANLDIDDSAAEPELNTNPDETIISISQININKGSSGDNENDTLDTVNTQLETDNPVVNTESTTEIATEDATTHDPAKKPPVKRKPRKSSVKAKVEAEITDKASDQNNVMTKTETDASTKN